MKKQTAALLLAAAAITAGSTCIRPDTATPAQATSQNPAIVSCIQANTTMPETARSTQTNRTVSAGICQLPLIKEGSKKPEEPPRMLVYNQRLYVDTGETSTAGRCGVMDGKVKKTVSAAKIPSKELQSNFGKGYSFQLGTRRNRLEVLIGDTWHIFAYNENNLEGVSMKVKRHTAKSAVLAIQNTNDPKILFGEDFLLEKKLYKTNEWRAVPYKNADIAFNDIGLLADKGMEVTWHANWDTIYGTLKPGTYRIVKEFFEEETEGTPELYTLTASFRVGSGS